MKISQVFSNKQRVLFIIHDYYQESNHQLPLGPAYLAAVLEKEGAYVEAYCMDVFHYTNEDLAKYLDQNHYDIIGVGFTAPRFRETILDLCKTISKHKEDAWLVLGGHGPSPIPEYVLRTTGANMVAIGESEDTIVELLKCKISNGELSSVKGIAYIEEDQLRTTPPRKSIRNLDEIPFPLWKIFPMDEYINSLSMFQQEKGDRTFVALTSRGCINRCNFCYRIEKGIRVRSVKNIIAEFKVLYERYGVNCFILQDELFLLTKRRMLDFEDELRKANLKIKYSCNARVDIIDEEVVEILKRTGCKFLNFGFESSDDKVLELMNKNATAEQNLKALEAVKKIGGIGIGLNFLWNNLGDTEGSLWKNAKLIMKYNTYEQIRTIRPVTPFPGCPLYYKLIEMGKLKGPGDFFDKFRNSDLMFINIMGISDKKAYKLLLEVNSELIRSYYKNTTGDMTNVEKLIRQFRDLYTGKVAKFRGSKNFTRKGDGELNVPI